MNKRLDNEENNLEILRKISDSKNLTQRELAEQVGFSLGKLNYCLNELRKKGLIKYNNFKNNKNKMNYVYIITPKGVAKKTKLLISFMQRKMKEYDEFKRDLENIHNQK
jgi:EPS-associated MarR family transcriptional regulator